MKQISLYRKYRPQHFYEVCGQNLLIDLLKNSIVNEKVSHSYIFAGERGTGKTSTARIFAKAVNCLDIKKGEPCDQCENCISIHEDSFMDVIEIDAASNNGVDEIRELRERVYYLPAKGKYKVYIIDEAHMITTQGFNAFLKTLEEPPDHVIFILATTEPEKILRTIHSRCQRFSFNKIDPLVIKKHVIEIAEKEGFHIHADAAFNIALSADGSIRDSLTILQEVIFFSSSKEIDERLVKNALGFVTENEIQQILELILNCDSEFELLNFTDTLFEQRVTLDSVINALFVKISDILRSPDRMSGRISDKYNFSLPQIIELSRYLMDCRRNLKNIKDENIFLKIVLFDMYKIVNNKEKASSVNISKVVKTFETETPEKKKIPEKKKKPEKKVIEPEKVIEKKQEIKPEKKQEVKVVEDIIEDDETSEVSSQVWSQIMQSLKKSFPLLHALIREAVYYEKKGNTLLVEFPGDMKFHKTTLDKPENKIKIRKILCSFFNSDIEPIFKSQGNTENENWKDDETEVLLEQARNMPAVKNIMKLFGGGKVVSVKRLDKLEDNEDG